MVPRSIRVHWPQKIKNRAKRLRKLGKSYGEISKSLGISKSTLHVWLHKIKSPGFFTKKDRVEHLSRIRILAAKANKLKREERLDKIRQRVIKEVKKYDLSGLAFSKSLLAMLYWAEGSKGRGTLAFANTDPKLALLYLTLLRKSYPIDEEKVRVRLHLHWYHPVGETRKFWSKLLRISESKFGKIYTKKRSATKKFRKNFAGICFIKYHSEDLRFEVLEQASAIADRLVPVA